MVDEELLDEAPVTWFLSYRGAPLLLLPIRLTELMMDFPQEIPATCTVLLPYAGTDVLPPRLLISCLHPRDRTLEGGVLRAAGGDEVEGHVGRPADVLVGKRSTGALVAPTHHALADKVSASDHKHQQYDGDDGADGVGAGAGDAARGRRHIL